MHDAARGLPWDDGVDAQLRRGLDRLLIAITFGQRLDENEPRVCGRAHLHVEHPGDEGMPVNPDHLGAHPDPGAVTDEHPFPDPQSVH